MKIVASRTKNNLSIRLSTFVILQMRCADPAKERGADTTTFSDAS